MIEPGPNAADIITLLIAAVVCIAAISLMARV